MNFFGGDKKNAEKLIITANIYANNFKIFKK